MLDVIPFCFTVYKRVLQHIFTFIFDKLNNCTCFLFWTALVLQRFILIHVSLKVLPETKITATKTGRIYECGIICRLFCPQTHHTQCSWKYRQYMLYIILLIIPILSFFSCHLIELWIQYIAHASRNHLNSHFTETNPANDLPCTYNTTHRYFTHCLTG
jgi:hypothetical protein